MSMLIQNTIPWLARTLTPYYVNREGHRKLVLLGSASVKCVGTETVFLRGRPRWLSVSMIMTYRARNFSKSKN